MKTLYTLLSLLLIIGFTSCTEDTAPEPVEMQSNKPDYFQGYWGESKATILQREGANHFENTDTRLSYYSYWEDRTNTYIFENNRLVGAETIIEKVADENYIAEYDAEVHSLQARQGRRQTEQMFWASDAVRSQYANVTSDLNKAIKAGHLRMVSTWSNNRTEVQLTVGNEAGNGETVDFRRVYRSK